MRPFSDVDLHAFVDGQVHPERRALIEAYLKAAPSEAARVDLWRRQNEAIRGVFAGAASEPVPLWLTIGQVAAGRERPAATPLEPIQDNRARHMGSRARTASPADHRHGRGWVLLCLVIAAFAAGFAMPYGVTEWPSRVQRWLPAPPREALLQRVAGRTIEAQRVFGTDPDKPVEMVESSPGALAAWLERHVGVPIRVPDLSRVGWALRGGRVVPGDTGRAALLVYESGRGDRLSLVAMPVDNPAPADTTFTTLDGPVLAWLDGPLGFGVASSKGGSWLTDNARSLYRAVYEDTAD